KEPTPSGRKRRSSTLGGPPSGRAERALFGESAFQGFSPGRALFVRGDARGEGQEQGAEDDQGDADPAQPADLEQVPEGADREADEDDRDVGTRAARQGGAGQGGVGH